MASLRLPDTYASKIAKKLQLLDVQACNSANRGAFQNPTKSLSAQWFETMVY